MPGPSFQQIEAVFQKAVGLPEAERPAFLAAQCGDDTELRKAVENLLRLDSAAASAEYQLESPVAAARTQASRPARQPSSLAGFELLRLIGRGGMGEVYGARQASPARLVALKVMRPGMTSANLRKRFAQEGQILQRLQHSGIAGVYETGETEDGRLYVAMELIDGLPLDEYVRKHGLDHRQVLELIARVCDAVQHAHEKGVVHRDLKPANLLVEEAGQPKVLDFGVAQIAGTDVQGSSAHTVTGQLIGTLGYMSPEQVSGRPKAIDARSDVYSLGVILFELLSRRLPYELSGLALPEIARVIQEDEPTRLGRLDSRLRGEVETIVAKALEKDPARRYRSAADLAADLRRFLNRQPIQAKPTTTVRRMRRFVSRNKALVAATMTIFASLVTATVFSALAARDARRAEAVAREQAYQARIGAAVSALASHDIVDATRHLEAAPPELRGWEWDLLHSQLDSSTSQLPVAGAFHPGRDGRPLLVTWAESGYRILSMDGAVVAEFAAKVNSYRNVAVAPVAAGFVMAYQDDEGNVRLHEPGRPERVAIPAAEASHHLIGSPDGNRIALETAAHRVHVYDRQAGRVVATWRHACADLNAAVFSPDGRWLALGGERPVVLVYDVLTGRLVAECRGHTAKVTALAFDSAGRRLLSGSHDGTVRQWDPATGKAVAAVYDRQTSEVFAVAYSPDGRRVASAGQDRTVRVWSAGDLTDLHLFHGHAGPIFGIAFEPGGRRLWTTSTRGAVFNGDATTRSWECPEDDRWPVLAGHTSYIYPVAFSPDGRWIASGSWDNTVRLWDARDGQCFASLKHPGIVTALEFGTDGRYLYAAGDFVGAYRIWDLDAGREVGRGPWSDSLQSRFISVTPRGDRIAISRGADVNTRVFLVDPVSNAILAERPGIPLGFDRNGKLLAVTFRDGHDIELLDGQTLEPVDRLHGHRDMVQQLKFSADGRFALSASLDRTLRLWDVETRTCRQVYEGHSDLIYGADFHPDGTRIASGGRDGAVWIWNRQTGGLIARLPGHTSYIYSLSFSPDGRSLVTGSGDSTVRVWGTRTSVERREVREAVAAERAKAAARVVSLYAQHRDWVQVAAAVRQGESWSEDERAMMRQEVLRRVHRP